MLIGCAVVLLGSGILTLCIAAALATLLYIALLAAMGVLTRAELQRIAGVALTLDFPRVGQIMNGNPIKTIAKRILPHELVCG